MAPWTVNSCGTGPRGLRRGGRKAERGLRPQPELTHAEAQRRARSNSQHTLRPCGSARDIVLFALGSHARRDQCRPLVVQGNAGQGRTAHDTAGAMNRAKRTQSRGVSSFKKDKVLAVTSNFTLRTRPEAVRAKQSQFASGRNERNRCNRKELRRDTRNMGLQKRSQFRRSFKFEVSSVKRGKALAGAGQIGFVLHAERRAPLAPPGQELGSFRTVSGGGAWYAPYERSRLGPT